MNPNEKAEPSGESWNYFLDEVKKRNQATASVYLRYMNEFLNGFSPEGHPEGFTPDELYDYFKSHLEAADRRKVKKLESELHKYYTKLLTEGKHIRTGEKTGLHISTVSNYENAVLCFLEANMIKSKLQYRVKFASDVKSEHSEQFTSNGKDKVEIDELRRLLDCISEPRNRSAILTMRDTGLRVSDIANLQVKHIEPILRDPNLEWYTFEITPVKNMRQETPLPANPCMGPESVEALRVWMNYRETKYGVVPDLESYVYCAIYDYPETGKRSETVKGEKIIPAAFSRMIRHERRKAGIKKDISPHSLRKTHSTNLVGAMVPERWVNIMIGKKGSGTQGVYQKPSEKELLEVYQKAYSSISLENLIVGEKVSQLNEKVRVQERQLEAMQKQISYLIASGGGQRRLSDDEMNVLATSEPSEPDLVLESLIRKDERVHKERLEAAKKRRGGTQ